MLMIKNATKQFGSRTLWKGISLDIPKGKVLGLVGASGSGKSTLLNCLGLLEDLSRGEIHLGQQRISGANAASTRKFRRDHLGYLFQNYALVENATISQNLDIAKPQLRRSAETKARQEAALTTVGLAGRGKEPVFRLSGGEQQRVALARLIVKNPSLILADEPTGALDADNAQVVIRLLRDLADTGAIVVIATHNDVVAATCDEVFKLG